MEQHRFVVYVEDGESEHDALARAGVLGSDRRLLTTALDKSETLQRRLADYRKASPELAHWLARWQADDAKA